MKTCKFSILFIKNSKSENLNFCLKQIWKFENYWHFVKQKSPNLKNIEHFRKKKSKNRKVDFFFLSRKIVWSWFWGTFMLITSSCLKITFVIFASLHPKSIYRLILRTNNHFFSSLAKKKCTDTGQTNIHHKNNPHTHSHNQLFLLVFVRFWLSAKKCTNTGRTNIHHSKKSKSK